MLKLGQRLKTRLAELNARLADYPDGAPERVDRAYRFAAGAHKDQARASGEAYIAHPLEVALILAEMRLDDRTLCAALLHDVVEDTSIALAEIERHFGDDVARLVDGVSKVSRLEVDSKLRAEAASFQKMYLAMANDIRVILIKLADRLHNMRTLDHLSTYKQRMIARQTMDIYAPMANRLGMREFCQQMEDLSFRTLYPKRYEAIDRHLKSMRHGRRRPVVQDMCQRLDEALRQAELKAQVVWREKSRYHIYRKLRRKHVHSLRDIHDIHGLRVITDSRTECYQALGIIHQIYQPKPGGFRDYIAIPKANGYQSLHTMVVGPFGEFVEVQVRSRRMHQVAEDGVASHWRYETGADASATPQRLAQRWLDDFLQHPSSPTDNPGEYLEHLKADLHPDEVYVFTPKGDIKQLPRGATLLDFAYSVHSDIGDHCLRGRIDREPAALHDKLRNGATVEITTSTRVSPQPSWLNYAVTARARAAIRHYLKQQQHKQAVRLGSRLFRQALRRQGRRGVIPSPKARQRVLEQTRAADWSQLMAEIGFGERLAELVAKQFLLNDTSTEVPPGPTPDSAITIDGTEGLVLHYAQCCHPIPGDRVVGLITRGRGVVVHRNQCRNCRALEKSPDSYCHLNWSPELRGRFPVILRLETRNKPGVLARVSHIIAGHDSNINRVAMDDVLGNTTRMTFTIDVQHRDHLANIVRELHAEPAVNKVMRG